MNKLFLFVFLLSGCYLVTSKKVMICYYGTWATHRAGLGKFSVDDVNTNLCSHIIYSFAGINSTGKIVSLDADLDLDSGLGNFRKFTNLKLKNSKLKTILAVGGWDEGSAKYSVMAGNQTYRRNFINSALAMIQEYNFDGLDLDWEYPNQRDTVHGPEDVDNFTQLTKEFKEVFDKYGLSLTAAVPSVKESASKSYNIADISKYLHFIHVMTYDMHGAWDAVTGHNSPLHKGEGDTEAREELYTVDIAVEYWLSQGCPPEKLVLGMPLYGRTFTLSDSNVHGVRAPASRAGLAGPYTATAGFMGYNEICDKLKSETWDVRYDSLAEVPYAVQGVNWISYDDVESLTKKVEYANSLNLAGGMVWSIETDDFHDICGGGSFPLLRAINQALGRNVDDTKPAEEPETVIPEEIDGTTKGPTTEELITTEKGVEETDDLTTTQNDGNIGEADTSTSTCKEEGFTANPSDCSSFYVCVTNVYGKLEPLIFKCPSSTYWDQTRMTCTYKDEVRCVLD